MHASCHTCHTSTPATSTWGSPPPNPFAAAPRSPPNPFSAAPHSPPTPPPAAPEVDLEEVVRGAVAVGFNEADAVRAVSAGHTDVDSVVNWILDNPV